MQIHTYDVLIVGAGPAGCACAIRLAQAGLRVALLDKAVFPRDKICGDALSVDVLNQLPMLSGSLAHEFENLSLKTASYGVSIFSPDSSRLDIPFFYKGQKKPGYICQRLHFDALLLNEVKQHSSVHIVEHCEVRKADNTTGKVLLHTSKGLFESQIVVGADGAQSVIGRQLGHIQIDRAHYSAGLRMYYEGVYSFHPENFIELYFFKDILPGYLWVFPLPDNHANVGIGMLSSAVATQKLNLRDTMHTLLHTHSQLKNRFRDAKPLENVKGFGLPLGSKKRDISGERFLLTGDAASLIDPFTGEGIGNAIRSGRVAAEHIVDCFRQLNFSASFNKNYDQEIYRRMWKELNISRTLQSLCTYPWLFNFLVKKANHNTYLQQFFIEALADTDTKRLLARPSFYYRLLMNR